MDETIGQIVAAGDSRYLCRPPRSGRVSGG